MHNEPQTLNTVTVPVGLGGKNPPYVVDPAPTVVVELAGIDSTAEHAEAASIVSEARREADEILDGARRHAEELEQSSLVEAETRHRAVEAELADVRAESEGRLAEAAKRESDLEVRRSELDARAARLDERHAQIDDRYAAVDRAEAEASRVLADAREQSGEILVEARAAAEAMLEDARIEAERAALALRDSVSEDSTDAADTRIQEIENIHRIEIQVLHDREQALHARIAELEHALEGRNGVPAASRPERAGENDERPSRAAAASVIDVRESGSATGDTDTDDDDGETGDDFYVEPPVPSRLSARTGTEPASHAPLIEQLSTTAFRTQDKDRRGRRRR